MHLFVHLLASFCACCDLTINASLGATHYSEAVVVGETICINTTIFPFFIIFHNVSGTTEYYRYSSYNSNRTNNQDYHSYVSSLTLFDVIEMPFSSVSLIFHRNSTAQFTIAALPGICTTGLYVSSAQSDYILMTPSSTGFSKLNNYDDKCFIFSNQMQQNLAITLSSQDSDDRTAIYSAFDTYSIYNGSFSSTLTLGSSSAPPIVRLILDRDLPPSSFSISLSSASSTAASPSSSSVLFNISSIPCETVSHWYSSELSVTLIIISAFLLVILVLGLAIPRKE